MNTRFLIAVSLAIAPFALAASVGPAAAQHTASPMSAEATLAEKRLNTLLESAIAGKDIDYSMMTSDVARVVRDHPEGGEMIISLGTPQSVDYLGDPPGCHLFRLTYATAKIDFMIALDPAGKISAMYYHPAEDTPS